MPGLSVYLAYVRFGVNLDVGRGLHLGRQVVRDAPRIPTVEQPAQLAGLAAERGAPLYQDDVAAQMGQRQRRRQSRRPPADHQRSVVAAAQGLPDGGRWARPAILGHAGDGHGDLGPDSGLCCRSKVPADPLDGRAWDALPLEVGLRPNARRHVCGADDHPAIGGAVGHSGPDLVRREATNSLSRHYVR